MMLRRASTEERNLLSKQRAEVWHGPLSRAQYEERNRRLYRHAYGKTIETWVWEVNGEIVSSLDCLPTQFQGENREGYLIASVMTPAEARGKGFASELLKAVLKTDLPYVLFSDIGFPFYERFGFRGIEVSEMTSLTQKGSVLIRELTLPFLLEKISFIRKGPVMLTSLWADWILERYRYFSELRGKALATVTGEMPDGHLVFGAVDPLRDSLDILWGSGECALCVEGFAFLGEQLGARHFMYWRKEGAGGKPLFPMLRGGTTAAMLDIQFCDWW